MYKTKNEAEIKVRVRRSPRGFFRKFILAIITFYIAYMIYGYVHDIVITSLAKAEHIREGILQVEIPARGLLVRQDQVVTSPRTGQLKVVATEGERVRVGQVVAQVVVPSLTNSTGESVINITAPGAGLISYHLDGLEGVFTPANIRELDLTKLDTIKAEPRQFRAGSQVEAGKPVCKIVNNLEPLFIAAELREGKLPDKVEKMLTVSFGPEQKDSYQVAISEKKFRGRDNQVLLNSSIYDRNLIAARQIDFKIISERYEGYIIPAAAIVRKESKEGIFTVYKERIKWKSVTVRGRVGDKVAISGITPDVKVIMSPEYVKEGTLFR